jgi:hypothetical protein
VSRGLGDVYKRQTIDSSTFSVPVATMTIAQSAGTLNLNSAAIVTGSSSARATTYPMYPLQADAALYMTFDMLLTSAPQTNCTVEAGLFQCTAVAAPIDGVLFRYDTTGVLKAVVNNNGTEVTSAAITAPSANVMHRYKIIIENDRALFYIDGVCVSIIATPTNLGIPTYIPNQPANFRIYTAASSPSVATTVKIGYVWVAQQDAAGFGKSAADIAAIMGRTGHQYSDGAGTGSTSALTNSLAAGAGAALTNTTAAVTALGGQVSVLPTLAVGTDGIVCAFPNPVAAAGVTGKMLYIRGVRIQGAVTTVFVGGPVIYQYVLCFGHTAVSLATTETATTKAPRRVCLGYETYPVTAAVGTLGAGVYMAFNAPIGINPGEFVGISAKNMGVVTTTGVITFSAVFDSYWE